MPLRRENGRRYASKDALFSADFFMEGDQNGLPYWGAVNCIK